MDGSNKQAIVSTSKSGRGFSVYRNLQRPRSSESYNYSKRNRGYKHNRYHKYLLAVTLLFANPSYAETIGGVSATASPVANSSGSVTNQAIQVLQGPYITNTYGGGIQCQGPTRNFSPYVTGTTSASRPWEPYYDDPVYDVTDTMGAFDDDGNVIPDGRIDNPGDILFTKKTRTGQKNNYSLGVGFSMTWSTPTDKKLQDLCKEAASSNIAMMQQITANKRLDFEIARLKNCGTLMQQGIIFRPGSKYASVCADVIVMNKNAIQEHVHLIPKPTSSSSPSQTEVLQSLDYDPSALLGGPLQTRPSVSSHE